MTFRSLMIAGLLAAPALDAAAGGIDLQSREYKLMLKPAMFADREPADAVGIFVHDQLAPLLARQLGGDAARKLAEKPFKVDKHRLVRFFDTPGCLLDQQRLALRARFAVDAPGDVELTLKYRSPDPYVTAGAPLRAAGGEVDTKLEEDIGPLAAQAAPKATAKPASMRSQFSLSSSRQIEAGSLPRTLGGLLDLYPDLGRSLGAGPGSPALGQSLDASPEFRETVYESGKIDLAEGHDTRFSITVWHESADEDGEPKLAEISFKYKVAAGDVPRDLALVGMNVFLAMQGLGWADPKGGTKTALVACATS